MKTQKGGFTTGLVIGLLIGLALALGVALYVNKVPTPFVNKVPQRTPEQDAAEAEHNKNWDPNAPLAGKVVKPIIPPASSDAASSPSADGTAAPSPAPYPGNDAPTTASPGSRSARDPASILSGQPATPDSNMAFTYFVQAGAFMQPDEAEQQHAKLAMMGLTAKVSERNQSGRPIYRVRLGPFERKEEAIASQERLQSAGIEAVLVRIEKH